MFPNKTHPNMVSWAAGVPFGPWLKDIMVHIYTKENIKRLRQIEFCQNGFFGAATASGYASASASIPSKASLAFLVVRDLSKGLGRTWEKFSSLQAKNPKLRPERKTFSETK